MCLHLSFTTDFVKVRYVTIFVLLVTMLDTFPLKSYADTLSEFIFLCIQRCTTSILTRGVFIEVSEPRADLTRCSPVIRV